MIVDIPSTHGFAIDMESGWLEPGVLAQPELLQAAFLTVVIEVPLFYLCGYRKTRDCLYFAGVNIVSNLLLNECLVIDMETSRFWGIVILCEAAVLLLEFVLCVYGLGRQDCRRLFQVLVITNAASFLLGILF